MRLVAILAYCTLSSLGPLATSFLAPEVVAAQEREATRPRAEELWEEAIAAKGGRARLQQVRNFVMYQHTGRIAWVRLRPDRVFIVFVYVLPGKSWWWADFRPDPLGTTCIVYNREIRRHNTGEFDLLRDQVFTLMETNWIKPAPLWTTKNRVKGRDVDLVHTRVTEEYTADFYLDATTHLPCKVEVFGRDSLFNKVGVSGRDSLFRGEIVRLAHADLSDYRPVQDIQMPHKVAWLPGPTVPVTYELNVQYDETIFNRPGRFADGPDAWRPK